jgi:hypothetical protein
VGVAPDLDVVPEALGELVDLVLGVQGGHLGAHRLARVVAAEVVPGDLLERAQVLLAEGLEALLVEAPGGQRAVGL